jgi:hypothetical protein
MAEKFEKLLDKATDASNPVNLKGQGFGSHWLGNILIACGYPVSYEEYEILSPKVVIGNKKHPEPAYSYRGDIVKFYRNDNIVTVSLETAWEPMPGVLATALHTIGVKYTDGVFDGITVDWESDEPGCGYYGGSNPEFCEGDIRVCGGIPVELYNHDEKLRDIFESYDDDGEVAYVDQRDYAKNLTRDINQYFGIKAVTSDKPFEALDEALKALTKKYPDISVSYDEYQFEDWLLGEFDPETDVLK